MTTTPTQEEIKAVVDDLLAREAFYKVRPAKKAGDIPLCAEISAREVEDIRSSLEKAADLIERLAAELQIAKADRLECSGQVRRLELHNRKMRGEIGKYTASNDGHLRTLIDRLDAAEDYVAADTVAWLVWWTDHYSTRMYKAHALADTERGRVSAHIKPLVWEKTYLGSWRAESPLGDYVVDRCDGWSWGWVYGEEYRGYSCDGLEDGKARAQADLVERISPMLTEGPAIPDGWKLVPIEPTPEMARCLESNIAECLPASEVHVANWRNAYRAMLNASPSPGGTSDAD